MPLNGNNPLPHSFNNQLMLNQANRIVVSLLIGLFSRSVTIDGKQLRIISSDLQGKNNKGSSTNMDYQGPPADDQQPPPYYQPPSAPTEVQQPSAPTDDQQPLADTKRPPSDDQLPPAYDQITAKRKFVGPLSSSRLPNPYLEQTCIQEYPEQSDKPVVNQPTAISTSRWSSPYSQGIDRPTALSTSRWSSPYSQQSSYVPLEEYPEQSDKPVVKQPAGDGIFSVVLGGEGFNTGQLYTTSSGGFNPGQQNTTTAKYPEDECLEDCLNCCQCIGYCCYCVACLCEILSAVK
ncbi:hypothetical protein JTE90_027008 [Oedothorax gibbosus]|uniref:Uncharacterized protein n=1 Tax=Oedothorax gibbosus TaxID=931172 RepID=A0AAV6V9H6_9ARAC|nr:hypothetical protein JTE90_027008 [Oedothorax gibbosus]